MFVKTSPQATKTIIQDLYWRYATKKFDSSQKLSRGQLELLQSVLALTPSSLNLQPWRFIIVESQTVKDRLLEYSCGQEQVVSCSHLIVIAVRKEITKKHLNLLGQIMKEQLKEPSSNFTGYFLMIDRYLAKMNKDQVLAWNKQQAYIALGFLLFACANLKIDACPMEGFDRDGYDRILALNREWTTAVICPVGFRSKDDRYSQRAKIRFHLEQVIQVC